MAEWQEGPLKSLLLTWKDIFEESVQDMPETNLIEYTNFTKFNVIPKPVITGIIQSERRAVAEEIFAGTGRSKSHDNMQSTMEC